MVLLELLQALADRCAADAELERQPRLVDGRARRDVQQDQLVAQLVVGPLRQGVVAAVGALAGRSPGALAGHPPSSCRTSVRPLTLPECPPSVAHHLIYQPSTRCRAPDLLENPMTHIALSPSVLDADLGAVGPRGRRRHRRRAAAPAGHPGDDRLRELRAGRRHCRRRAVGAHEQVRRGLPRPALLRRLRARRRRRDARHRAGQGPLRRGLRQRPAALGRPGEHGGHASPCSSPATPSSGSTWPTAAT